MGRSSVVALALFAIFAVPGSAWSQTTHTVVQAGLSFSPSAVLVECGDNVRWVWTGGGHTVTEGTDPGGWPDAAYNEPLTASSPSLTVTFDTRFLFLNPRPGHVYEYLCLPHFDFNMLGSVTVTCPWADAGSGLAGVSGDPLLYGDGPLSSGSVNTLELEAASPNSPAVLFVALGPAGTGAPFKGGTLIPVPILVQVGLTTSAAGTITVPFVMPAGLGGVDLLFQWAISDAAAVKNVSLSNGMSAAGQ